MDPRQSRTLIGLMGLVVLWIVLYWTWQPRSQREPVVILPNGPEQPEREARQPEPAPVRPQPEPRKPEVVKPAEPERSRGEQTPFGEAPFRWVTVQPGDTFAKIAQRELGSGELWTAVARANPLKDPNRLRVGDRVKVPIDPNNPQGRPDAAPPQTPSQPQVKVIEYTVKAGDTLSGIAQEFYGSVRYVEFIYQSNRDRLRSKDDLKLGQVLRLPPKPSDEDGRP